MRTVILCTILLALAACGERSAPLVATDVVARAPLPGATMGAAYLTLVNDARDDVVITRIDSPNFRHVEMHETRHEDGVARMSSLDTVTVPAGGTVEFVPGGKHLMMMRPTDDDDRITLRFYAGDTLVLTVETQYVARDTR